jgi:glycosyltransferase involved in cell wall biosynthesis
MTISDLIRGRTERGSGTAKSLIRRADAERDARDWSKAAASYAAALEASPRLAHIWVQYGHALKEDGRREEAEAAYRQALAIDSTVADTHLQLGHLLKLRGRLPEAAEAYRQALLLDPGLHDALRELNQLAARGIRPASGGPGDVLAGGDADPSEGDSAGTTDARQAQVALTQLLQAPGLDAQSAQVLRDAIERLDGLERATASAGDDASPVMVFDAADLFGYFRNARLPTGIQRVQIEVISSLLRQPGGGAVHVCSFSEALDAWVEVPSALFLKLCALSLADGDTTAPDWTAMLQRLDITLASGRPFAFPRGAFLVNLGTSWWLQNYFLQVRRAKAEHAIRYAPFVHDLIPIMTPEHCVEGLTQDFITWVLGVFQHADFFLVNSLATRRDLMAVAERLGHGLDEARIEVVRLDADARKPELGGPARSLKSFGLEPGRFVLFVSTIESRKNHLGALNAWLNLMRRHGTKSVPKLVCVGNQGWLNDAVHAKLKSSELLRERVVMLSRLSDAELAALYRGCLFTLYPSHYEGWGLPVTESLCYGKVSLVSSASSLPEAGGDFADYFEAGSDAALTDALDRLIFDDEHRAARERAIADGFRPRAWAQVGGQIRAAVAGWAERFDAGPQDGEDATAMPACLGVHYPMQRNFALRIWPGMVAGEMFRAGSGWWWPDDWGAWTRPEGGQLAIRVGRPHGALRGLFRIRGLLDEPCDWTLAFEASGAPALSGRMAPGEACWVCVDLPASETGLVVRATLRSAQTQDLGLRTQGLDPRITGVGFEGFHLCEADDALARAAFAEAVATGGLDRLTPGYRGRWS